MSDDSKVLLVLDDEAFVRESFVDYFEDCLWEVEFAEKEDDALSIIKDRHIDCAIVDIRMAGIGGDQFIREANKIRPGIVFAVCTGSPEYEMPDDILLMENVSKQIYAKPVSDLESLEEELRTLVDAIK